MTAGRREDSAASGNRRAGTSRRAWALLAALAPAVGAAAPATTQRLAYDVKIAWLEAGKLSADIARRAERYELAGNIVSSKAMDRFFRWRGRFAATGALVAGFPTTRAYLLFEDDGEEREVLLATAGTTNLHRSGGRSKSSPAPPGSDLMSVLFLAPHCLPETEVHDGQSRYHLRLYGTAEQVLRQSARYYSGATTRCDYRFRYSNGTVRRISLWMADWRGARAPVRVRVRIPLLPDVVLRLRTDSDRQDPQ